MLRRSPVPGVLLDPLEALNPAAVQDSEEVSGGLDPPLVVVGNYAKLSYIGEDPSEVERVKYHDQDEEVNGKHHKEDINNMDEIVGVALNLCL